MADLEIETGGLKVLDSGYVTAFKDEPILFTISHEEDEDDMIFQVDFIDKKGEDAQVEMDVLEEGIGNITIMNHREGIGQHPGPVKPFNVGSIGGQEVYFIYQVIDKDVEDEDYTTTTLGYTWYLGEYIDE